ncbi:MAG: dihydrofolate reductase family protein, partial [Pseudomonadota bacterium]
ILQGQRSGGGEVASGALDLRALLEGMAARGVGGVLVEGGGALAAALIAGGFVDRLVMFSAGAIIGSDGHPAVGGLGLEQLAAAPRFRRTALSIEGSDVMSVWEPLPPGA